MNQVIKGLGIDQGIANCGYSVIFLYPDKTVQIVDHGTLVTNAKKSLPQRIQYLHDQLLALAKDYEVNTIGCERLFFSPKQATTSTTGKKRNKSASIVYTNMITGIIYLISSKTASYIHEFVPGTIKKYVTGNGKATKDDIIQSIQELFPSLTIKTDHEADAIAIGISAVKYYQEQNKQ